jgi:hypothetical protein
MQLYLDVSAMKFGTCELDLHEAILLVGDQKGLFKAAIFILC